MSLTAFLTNLFKPLTDVVTHVLPSGDAKVELQGKILEAQIGIAEKLMAYESQLLQAQADAIKAEATGTSAIQRTWRPITMLTFLGLVVVDAFGILPFRLADEAWTLLQIGLGGYVAGRSAEKIAVPVMDALKKRK